MTRRPGTNSVLDRAAISRRCCIRGAIAVSVGATVVGASALIPAEAVDKVSKQLASYQDQPKGKEAMCAVCKYFISPASCLVVEGTVSPQGWCQRFEKRVAS